MSVYQDDDDGKQAQQKEIHFKLCIYKTMDKTSRAEKETEKKNGFSSRISHFITNTV